MNMNLHQTFTIYEVWCLKLIQNVHLCSHACMHAQWAKMCMQLSDVDQRPFWSPSWLKMKKQRPISTWAWLDETFLFYDFFFNSLMKSSKMAKHFFSTLVSQFFCQNTTKLCRIFAKLSGLLMHMLACMHGGHLSICSPAGARIFGHAVPTN